LAISWDDIFDDLAVHLRVDRVGDHVAHEKSLIEADQPVHLVVGVGLVLAGVVLLGFEAAVVVDVVG